MNSETGVPWRPRYAIVKGEMGGRGKLINVETVLQYRKLRRSGKLLRSIKTTPISGQGVTMSVGATYGRQQDTGLGVSARNTIKTGLAPGVKSVTFARRNVARPFTAPSLRVMGVPHKELKTYLNSLGW